MEAGTRQQCGEIRADTHARARRVPSPRVISLPLVISSSLITLDHPPPTGQLSRAWNEWEAKAVDRRRKVELIRRAMLRMRNTLLGKTFDVWASEVAERRAQREKQMLSAINRMR